MTTSVSRPCFTTQHQTCKTKTKTDFLVSGRSCPKIDGLRPHYSRDHHARGGGWLDVLFVGDMRSLGSSSFWSNAQRAIYSEKKKESIRSEIQITDTVFVNRRTHHSMGSARVLLFSSGSRGGRTRRAPPLFSEEKRIFKNIYYLLNKILIYCVFNQLLTKFQ